MMNNTFIHERRIRPIEYTVHTTIKHCTEANTSVKSLTILLTHLTCTWHHTHTHTLHTTLYKLPFCLPISVFPALVSFLVSRDRKGKKENRMNVEREDDQAWCYFHPRELVIGVCALCLKERLLVLAASKHSKKTRNHKVLPKIFALTSLINPLDIITHKKSDLYYDDHSDSSTTQEDSFISIKFEDNGVGSWDRDVISKIPNDHGGTTTMDNNANRNKSVVEHAKPRSAVRWRKRVGHLLHLSRWKRPSGKGSSSMSHGGTKLEGSKVKQGWIRILTKRRTRE